METSKFFNTIRQIIREEVEYAIDKKMNSTQLSKKSQIKELQHGMDLHQTVQKSNLTSDIKKQKKTNFNSIHDLLEETRRSLQESYDIEDELHFTSDMAKSFGSNKHGAIPHGVEPNEVPDDVMSALTRNYSDLMKKIDEKKGR
jgi:hypothetical protein